MNASTALVRGRDARSQLPPPVLTLAAGRQHTAQTILRAWFEGKADHTIRSYRHDLEDFALFLSRSLAISPPLDVERAAAFLFKQSSPSAHELVLAFRHHLEGVHLSAASINRHLACLRSVTKLGRMLGMMTWYLEVAGVKLERRREVRGPAVSDIKRMLAASSADTEAETRDAAIVTTFYCLGLRVSELCGLTLEATDLGRGHDLDQRQGTEGEGARPAAGGRGECHPPVSPVSWHGAGPVVPDPRPAREAPIRRARDALRAAAHSPTRATRRPARLVSQLAALR